MTWSSYLFDWLCGMPRQLGSVTTAAGRPKRMKTIKLFTKIDLSLNSVVTQVSYYSYSHVTHIGFPYLTNDFFYTKAQHRSFIIFFLKKPQQCNAGSFFMAIQIRVQNSLASVYYVVHTYVCKYSVSFQFYRKS